MDTRWRAVIEPAGTAADSASRAVPRTMSWRLWDPAPEEKREHSRGKQIPRRIRLPLAALADGRLLVQSLAVDPSQRKPMIGLCIDVAQLLDRCPH